MPFKYGPVRMQHYSKRWATFTGDSSAMHSRTLCVQRGIRRFSVVFLVIYFVAIACGLVVFLRGGDVIVLEKDDEHQRYVPKMPLRNGSDGCHDNPDAVLSPRLQSVDNDTIALAGYYDDRGERVIIRVLALRRERAPQLYCLISDEHSRKLLAIAAETKECGRTESRLSGMLLCDVTGYLTHTPCKVRLSRGTTLQAGYITLPLTSLQQSNTEKGTFGVCVPPLQGAIPQSQLIEFIEITKLLGADQIYFYRQQANPNVDQILDFYKTDRAVTVRDWSSESHIQLATHHCLYSAMNKHQYVTQTSLDRFLIPHDGGSWAALMQSLDFNNTSPYSAFCFPVATFPRQLTFSLNTAFSMVRMRRVEKGKTQCIVKPQHVLEMSSRPVFVQAAYKATDVDDGEGLVHWYRVCAECVDIVKDLGALRYKKSVLARYISIMQRLSKLIKGSKKNK